MFWGVMILTAYTKGYPACALCTRLQPPEDVVGERISGLRDTMGTWNDVRFPGNTTHTGLFVSAKAYLDGPLPTHAQVGNFGIHGCHMPWLSDKRWSSNGSQPQVYQDLRSVFNCNANQLCGTCVLDVMEARKKPKGLCMEVRWPQGFESSLAWTSLKYWIEIPAMPQKSHLASNVSIKNQTDMKYKHSQHFFFKLFFRGTPSIRNDWCPYTINERLATCWNLSRWPGRRQSDRTESQCWRCWVPGGSPLNQSGMGHT